VNVVAHNNLTCGENYEPCYVGEEGGGQGGKEKGERRKEKGERRMVKGER
jgi:hypothetical protein